VIPEGYDVHIHTDRPGNDITGSPFVGLSLSECVDKCSKDSNCKSLVYGLIQNSYNCYLKKAFGALQYKIPSVEFIGNTYDKRG
jgi:hypothetical protein